MAELLEPLFARARTVDEHAHRVSRPGRRPRRDLLIAARAIDDADIPIDDLGLRRPSLDDVFLALTGHGAEDADESDAGEGHAGRLRRKRKAA